MNMRITFEISAKGMKGVIHNKMNCVTIILIKVVSNSKTFALRYSIKAVIVMA